MVAFAPWRLDGETALERPASQRLAQIRGSQRLSRPASSVNLSQTTGVGRCGFRLATGSDLPHKKCVPATTVSGGYGPAIDAPLPAEAHSDTWRRCAPLHGLWWRSRLATGSLTARADGTADGCAGSWTSSRNPLTCRYRREGVTVCKRSRQAVRGRCGGHHLPHRTPPDRPGNRQVKR